LKRSKRIIAFIETYCLVPEGALVGQPIKLAPFQKKFIRDVYDNKFTTSTAILTMARKNAKTALIACLVLTHLVGPEAKRNSQIISGAQSRDQAAQVYNYASKMVMLNHVLTELVKITPSKKMLHGLPLNVEYQALAAEAKTAHGLSPILAILDETGQVKGPYDPFIDAITTAQGAHENPLLIYISTQAAEDGDLLSILIDDAVNSGDPHIVCHLYSAKPDSDVMDRCAWKAANPALGLFRSLTDLRRQAEKAERMPSAENTFRNLCLNQRVNSTSPFISRNIWLQNSGDCDNNSFITGKVYAGLDLSARNDLTALAICTCDEWGTWHVKCEFFAPKLGIMDRVKRDRVPYDVWSRDGLITLTPGASVDYSFVASRLCEICDDYNIVSIAFDRWRIDVLQKELKTLHIELPLKPFGQGFKDMSPALDILEAELMQGRVKHGNNPVLTMCASNAVSVKDPAGNRKLDKSKATGRIDGMVALAMAIGAAFLEQEEIIVIRSSDPGCIC
jgi:phage terminase large subunit-like protein